MRRNRGITLIALVITIIVLLILAAVSIQAITGDNGIATKAKNAKEQSEIGTEKEQIKLSYSSCKLDIYYDLDASISASHLENKMNDSYGEGTVEVTGDRLLTVFYTETEREYLVLANGTVLNKDETLKNLTYENAVGIAEDGSLVDMTLWRYEYIVDDNSYMVGTYFISGAPAKVYYGEFIDGKIEGKIPAYILDLRIKNELLPVTAMEWTFAGCDELIYPPQIPSSVTDMYSTFAGCSNLVEAPKLPAGVTQISQCFSRCTNLLEAPEIPNGVLTMSYTFGNCKNLKKAPDIPESVNDMSSCFENAAINEGCELILTGSSSLLNNFLNSKSENSNIRIGN